VGIGSKNGYGTDPIFADWLDFVIEQIFGPKLFHPN